MMYRSGWATKPGQGRILAIDITRSGFEDALSKACLSHYDPDIFPDRDSWEARKRTSPVRVQWDPERDITLNPLSRRSLQVGLSGEAAHSYVTRWTVRIEDITSHVNEVHHQVASGHGPTGIKLPPERLYPLPDNLARIIGAATAH